MTRQYYVYILANISRSLCVGMTNSLERRIYEHKQKLLPGFTSKYNITHLVYVETTAQVAAAIAREKQIKGWLRRKKVALMVRKTQPGRISALNGSEVSRCHDYEMLHFVQHDNDYECRSLQRTECVNG